MMVVFKDVVVGDVVFVVVVFGVAVFVVFVFGLVFLVVVGVVLGVVCLLTASSAFLFCWCGRLC